ncbi:MAG TPA: hypothetical protein VE571_05280 [Solirubrobacteraceae bacterium]|nr:hypothetical protein [Solirubrobacteraceae bacterium]
MAYLDAYGLEVETDITLPGMQTTRPGGRRQRLTLRGAPAQELPSPIDDPRYLRNLQAYDGAPYVMLEGTAGDVLFAYGRTALFHLSADHAVLRCAVADEDEPTWQRVLLDTILWTVSLLRGFELLHASAVLGPHGLIALVGQTGGGKTSLAAEFLRRGAALYSDDVLALDDVGGPVVAHPGLALMNLPRPLGPEELGGGRILADFGDERWAALDRHAATPAAPASIVLINRAAGERPRCTREAATSLTLLPHAISLPHLDDRARRRFDIFSAVVAAAPVFALHADLDLSPSDLADLIEDALANA